MYNTLGGNNMIGMFGKGARVGNEVDMYAGQAKAKVENAIMTLKMSDNIEMQFNSLAQMAKASGDLGLASQFEMLKNSIDMMQNQVVMQLNGVIQDLQKIDNATDKVQY